MKKLFLIGFKDVKLAFRDRTALMFSLLAPFLLTLGMGFVTGAYAGGSSGIEQIPVALVNLDEGELGQALVDLFQSDDLSGLVTVLFEQDVAGGQELVDEDDAAAAVIIPAGFTDSIIPPQGSSVTTEVLQIMVYKNPLRPVSAGVIQSIVEEFTSRVETGRVAGQVVVSQLLAGGYLTPDQIPALAAEIGESQANPIDNEPAITLAAAVSGEQQVIFNPMAYMAPGMALMFLMFTVSNGGRSLLAERSGGTLPRLLVSPTTSAQVLIGKVFGIYLTGVLQMLILIVSCSLLFGIHWGDFVGVLVLILAAVFAAVGWGMLITAVVRTPGQVGALGSAIMLTFGILGGSFIQVSIMPAWFKVLSRITPNAWGLDGFTILALGGSLGDLGKPLLGLLVMGIILGAFAVLFFSRRSLTQK